MDELGPSPWLRLGIAIVFQAAIDAKRDESAKVFLGTSPLVKTLLGYYSMRQTQEVHCIRGKWTGDFGGRH
ncbi:MAG: hypothetical protein ACYCSN_15495 [Acidobacteriaceae bacterium]